RGMDRPEGHHRPGRPGQRRLSRSPAAGRQERPVHAFAHRSLNLQDSALQHTRPSHMNTFYRILKRCMAGAACSAPLLLSAQVHTYEFTESVGTYTEISEADGGVALGIPAYWPHVNNNRAWVNNPFNDPDGQVTGGGY